ncbi:hypothetical protein NC653_034555 [Populus alba x Populus x berolinensis]|uniref:Uncharacterized protein n=1 Tax=Populus alba x Populus x berolinensis TaxID=444605 RepID=A0AAD6LMT3_9ROSI|nr:hypothetical protein NC653_034555 [Populus alba x Populus x berolinensis]
MQTVDESIDVREWITMEGERLLWFVYGELEMSSAVVLGVKMKMVNLFWLWRFSVVGLGSLEEEKVVIEVCLRGCYGLQWRRGGGFGGGGGGDGE